jgi:DNA repair protein RadC
LAGSTLTAVRSPRLSVRSELDQSGGLALSLKCPPIKNHMPKAKESYKIPSYRIQLVREGYIKTTTICAPRDILRSIKPFIRSDREQFIALYLDARSQVIAHHIVSVGTTNATLVHPREVFKPAIIKNACAVIVAHNHPSGGAEPSENDLELTERLREAGRILGIELMDHLIITPDGKTQSIV